MYEYGTLKPVKVILKSGKEKRENNVGGREVMNHTGLHCIHIWKYRNETYLLIKIFKNQKTKYKKGQVVVWLK
jgi:hypothetical protein